MNRFRLSSFSQDSLCVNVLRTFTAFTVKRERDVAPFARIAPGGLSTVIRSANGCGVALALSPAFPTQQSHTHPLRTDSRRALSSDPAAVPVSPIAEGKSPGVCRHQPGVVHPAGTPAQILSKVPGAPIQGFQSHRNVISLSILGSWRFRLQFLQYTCVGSRHRNVRSALQRSTARDARF